METKIKTKMKPQMAVRNESGLKKFKKVVILDSVIFYPEHRKILNRIAEEIEEYPSSLPENLERQYTENPDLFKHKKCYTHIAADNTPIQLLMNRCEGADVIISCWTNIPDEIINLNKDLKVIIFWTHEKEHRINMELVRARGIKVYNIPDYGTDSVAEVVFAGLFTLLERNFLKEKDAENAEELALQVLQEIFRKYRLLEKNEKEIRRGQFLHHFHKLGMVKFNITNDNLSQVIPERLIEDKSLGIVGKSEDFDYLEKLAKNAFKMNVERFELSNSNSAEYYKFFSENETIVLDSRKAGVIEMEKIKKMFGDKIIDSKELKGLNYSLKNKQLGIIGLGRIGTRVARIARELGIRLVYYSKTRKTDLENELNIKHMGLDELMKTSDIVSVHLPAHKANGLLSKEKLSLLKEGAIFINTADGNIADQHALTKLMTGKKVYSFLDVYPGLPRKDILGLEMDDASDWKLREILKEHVLSYRAGWKSQESIRVKTYKLLGHMVDYLLKEVKI